MSTISSIIPLGITVDRPNSFVEGIQSATMVTDFFDSLTRSP